jgi:hypothetical protein
MIYLVLIFLFVSLIFLIKWVYKYLIRYRTFIGRYSLNSIILDVFHVKNESVSLIFENSDKEEIIVNLKSSYFYRHLKIGKNYSLYGSLKNDINIGVIGFGLIQNLILYLYLTLSFLIMIFYVDNLDSFAFIVINIGVLLAIILKFFKYIEFVKSANLVKGKIIDKKNGESENGDKTYYYLIEYLTNSNEINKAFIGPYYNEVFFINKQLDIWYLPHLENSCQVFIYKKIRNLAFATLFILFIDILILYFLFF